MDIEYFTQILQDFGLSEKSFNVVTEPEYSKSLLLNLEKKYKTNTEDFFSPSNTELPSCNLMIGPEDSDTWYQAYSDFIFFEGELSELNSNRQTQNLFLAASDDLYQYLNRKLDDNYLNREKKEGEYTPSFFYGLHTTC